MLFCGMAMRREGDKLSGLLLLAAMAAIAVGVRAWPHRFVDARVLTLPASVVAPWPAAAIAAPPAISVAVTTPALSVAATAVPRRLPARHRSVSVTTFDPAPVSQPSRVVAARAAEPEPAPLPVSSRPITGAVAAVMMPAPVLVAAPPPSLARAGVAVGHAFSVAGRRTARAFTRAF